MDEVCRPSVAFIAVGSNIDPQKNIAAALIALASRVRVVSSSTFYQTEPVGREDQAPFVNGVWRIDTTLEPLQIKNDLLQPVERKLGRRRTADKFTPRTIDLDLVLYDDLVLDNADLRLPHPDIVRPFVYAPVRELLECGNSGIASRLRERIARLLPGNASGPQPGEPLTDFTEQLTRLLDRSAREHAG
ncbi:MAG: 2-amino-4-hydroxy-6-hydroxymethyldihydropteridine diphosphokinase [Planctomycetota bacterium]|jgi:2-amino-4-hydroxy-6-hydroxymethyldihydropteridine diphosphokinase